MNHNNREHESEWEKEDLGEFRFLFQGLQDAISVHPPQHILKEYIRGARPKGIDSQGWQSHSVSVHVGICPSCQLQLKRLRRHQSIEQLRRTPIELWRNFLPSALSRRAAQYLGILVLMVGLIAVYYFLKPEPPIVVKPPMPPPVILTTDSPRVIGGGG
jgi:hypothetical protein